MNNSKYTIILIYVLAFIPVILAGQQTVTLNPKEDAFIRICANPSYPNIINTNYGTTIFNNSDEWTIGGYRLAGRMVMKFDLGVIPEDVDITSATISLYAQNPQINDDYKHRNFTVTNNSGYKLNACYLERITSSWDGTTVTWATQPATSTSNRVTLGESLTVNQNYENIDVTALVTDMINDRANSYGIMMRLINEVKYARMSFCSMEHPDASLHPKLIINYKPRKDKIQAGLAHCVLLKTDGSIWTWGLNYYGELGLGSVRIYDYSYPMATNSGNTWVNISSTYNHTLAIKSDGSLWAWGDNSMYQLACLNCTISTNIPASNTPIQVGTATNWKAIAAGGYHSLAIKTDGTLWAWGDNSSGQLGCTSCGSVVSSPTQVGTDANWVAVSAGNAHSLAIKNDGTLWAWGYNIYGQLGDASNTNKNAPVKIGSDTNWKVISAGGTHSFGIKSDGTLWGWGDNSIGQITGTSGNKNVPFQITNPAKTWVKVSAGVSHTMAQASDGTTWAWGNNYYGQIGDGNYEVGATPPFEITDAANCLDIDAGGDFSMIMKSSQYYCGTGSNSNGQLGNSTFNDVYTYQCTSYATASKSAKITTEDTKSSSNSEAVKTSQVISKLGTSYPNPAKATTTIGFFVAPDVTQAKLVIQSLSGGYNKEYPIIERGDSYLNIDLQNLPSGVYSYYLIINGSRGSEVKKLLKIK